MVKLQGAKVRFSNRTLHLIVHLGCVNETQEMGKRLFGFVRKEESLKRKAILCVHLRQGYGV